MDRVIGLDLDNTIVSYDHLIHDEATRRGLVARDVPREKRSVRDAVRRLNEGEIEWQRIQGCVYGPRMMEAEIFSGVEAFLERCRSRGVQAMIISHKTEYANYDETRTPLRKAALELLSNRGIVGAGSAPLTAEDVHFASTREEKIQLITKLGCTHFLDDLEELFCEASFPPEVEGFLFRPTGAGVQVQGPTVVRSWAEFGRAVFGPG